MTFTEFKTLSIEHAADARTKTVLNNVRRREMLKPESKRKFIPHNFNDLLKNLVLITKRK